MKRVVQIMKLNLLKVIATITHMDLNHLQQSIKIICQNQVHRLSLTVYQPQVRHLLFII
jgi:hypothetical protein